MKIRFLFLFFVLFFIAASCSGSDPLSESEMDENLFQDSENSDNSLPDPTTSEDGNDTDAVKSDDKDENDKINDSDSNNSSSDTDETANDDADSADDSADSTNGSTDSQLDNDADSTNDSGDSVNDSDDDDTNPADNDTDTADSTSDADADADTDSGEADLTVILPFGGAPVDKTIKLDTKITKIDVLLMVDLSGLISSAHDNLKSNVKTAIIDGILEKTPDSAFGVVTFGTIEQGNPYNLAQPITKYANDIRNAVDKIEKVTSGNRTYHGLALWEAASGEADYEHIVYEKYYQNTETRKINIPAVDCTDQIGNIGGACFRSNAMPVFVMMTAKKFSLLTYDTGDNFGEWKENTEKKTRVKAAEKMNAINAKFIGVSVNGTDPKSDFEDIAKRTKSQDTAEPANYFNIVPVGADDEAFSAKIAEQVNFLTENIRLDVIAKFAHKDNEYGIPDTTQFVKSFYPEAAQKLKAGNKASFDITFENNFYENTTCEPHNFYITVEAIGEGLVLDDRDIKIVVPGNDCGETH